MDMFMLDSRCVPRPRPHPFDTGALRAEDL